MAHSVCKRCGGGFWESEKGAREEDLCDECEGKPAPKRAARRSVEVFDIPSGLGGSHTVEIVSELHGGMVRLRVWYGRATVTGWEPWKDWDGYRFEADRAELKNKRTMPLFK
ncbi:hypothetical protein C8J38_1278 [Rhizobium sp. PP-WC-2G-219]|nr:hypothetical protein C8J38_1278 [Rhizobium sp. PP-WC-2G-219]TCP73795.1 hypothetical protein C8J31_1553 [Rhizobium sp. PP-CC-2G-626]TCQ03367.1 hypothetical protein C8J34_11281 [Rhizobium sp. PP-F2F-G36]